MIKVGKTWKKYHKTKKKSTAESDDHTEDTKIPGTSSLKIPSENIFEHT